MLDLRYFTETEQKKLLKTITVLVDTREHDGKNTHILEYFDKNKIPWKKFKLDHGDYSFMLPASEEFGINADLYFDKRIMVERKCGLVELSGNYSQDRTRIKTEFAGSPPHKVLLIENASYKQLVEGDYNTNYSPKAFYASLMSMWHQYGIPVFFMEDAKYSGQFIYGYFYYYLRNIIK